MVTVDLLISKEREVKNEKEGRKGRRECVIK